MEYKRVATCADRIKEALRVRGKKQVDLCQLTKIPKSALSQYLSGAYEPKQDRIYLISKALNVSEAWLMGLDVPMDRQKNSPPVIELTEGEKATLELIRQTPEAKNLFNLILSLTEDEVKQASDYLDYIISKRGK